VADGLLSGGRDDSDLSIAKFAERQGERIVRELDQAQLMQVAAV
jgi:hypothetical protein